ncbi:MAG: Tricarboxylate transport sensor protein TctE [uncultured Friedmanniella sp.]|uniref:histidine kinase n=1 Tax=uncultured Friedmanniella sp. TaxID=335381 RepID=A0A6J4K3Y0_9ACTN|nr:ATP-binding protein [uncultured Friedmanniella sp.]CAA9294748.1 MAG: Tricarboxylate transport sensor protein TctE [uncultured Friedmanniella sp.]
MAVIRRLSLATQLVLVQLILIAAVLVAVSAVSVEQTRATFERVEGRRVLALAESLAANPTVRLQPVEKAGAPLPATVTTLQSTTGVDLAAVADLAGVVVVSTDPRLNGTTIPWPEVIADPQRSRSATVNIRGTEFLTAAVPILSNPDQDNQPARQLGIAIAAQTSLTRWSSLASAAPTLLTYLGAAMILGTVGSLLLARWIKRQTLGMEPADMVAFAEQREAIFAGIAEGVLALDTRNEITFVNPLATALLSLPANSVGQSLRELGIEGRLLDVLTATGSHEPDEVVIRAGRVLVLNRMPVVHNGRTIGSVTTLRDRTELAEVESELGAFRGTADLLRAQAHEFGNQLHTISGLIEIGEYDEVVGFVDTLVEKRASLDLTIARRVQDRSVAALLLAKAALAAEKKVVLRVSDRTGLSPLRTESSFDVATVLGNLIDNGIDAVITAGRDDRWVEVEIRQSDTSVELAVTDSGPGIEAELATEVFEHGYTTKAAQGGERGIGLALTLLICKRRGGEVVASNTPDGAQFIARMTVTPGSTPTTRSDRVPA